MSDYLIPAGTMQDALGGDVSFYVTGQGEVHIEAAGGAIVLDAEARDEFVRQYMGAETQAEAIGEGVFS